MPTTTSGGRSFKSAYPGFKWDKTARRYRDTATGRITPKRDIEARLALDAHASGLGVEAGYGRVINFNRHPDSDIHTAIERMVGQGESGVDLSHHPLLNQASERFNQLLAHVDRDNMDGALAIPFRVRDVEGNWVQAASGQLELGPPQPIPTGIRSAMSLAEYYCNTEGDVWQHIEAPIDLSITNLEISVPKDKKIELMLQELYGPEKLNMKYVLYQLMLNMGIFGSAYPMEIPDDPGQPHEIVQVMPLPPKFMWVGYHITSGGMLGQGTPSPYAIRPFDGAANWTQQLAQSMFMPMTYNAFGSGFNEQNALGWGLPVDPQYLHPVRSKALHWVRYPLPPISRAFRSISTRAVYHEMRRSLLEGFKNQLWVFLLGTEKLPPSPQEMLALTAAINGLSGSRTGNLVWRNGLEVKVIAPVAIQDAIANEVSQAFTLEVFRDLGANVRLVTGNKIAMPGSGGGDTGMDVDLSVWLRRMEYIRNAVQDWEFLFRMRQAARWDGGPDGPARQALLTANVSFSKSMLAVAEAIKSEVIPLYATGLTSPQTSLEKAGLDYQTELANKKEFKKDQELFMPMPTYNQTATDSSGKPSSSSSTPKGRTPDAVNPHKLKAAFTDSETRARYYEAIRKIIVLMWEDDDVDGFVRSLKAANVEYLAQVGREAYAATGGMGTLDPRRETVASDFVNGYADHFGDFLKAKLAAGETIATTPIRDRAMLYPQEGFKAAVVNAQNQAMAERGASHWRRVLHPELSRSGPCPECTADSKLVHGMDEAFQVMHPNEVCGTQEINLQYFTNGIPSIEVPTPMHGNELAQEVFGLARRNGSTRRKRVT